MSHKEEYRQDDIMENIAAIAMCMGESKNRNQAYKAAAGSMGGFPGFYDLAIELGISLQDYAEKKKIIWGKNADWLLTTAELAEALLLFMSNEGRRPSTPEMVKLIKGSVRD